MRVNEPSTPVADENSSAAETNSAPRMRNVKTPLQKEALEAAYQIKKFPEEEIRRALGKRIGLTEQQVQVWFSHKRRKEKREQDEAELRKIIEMKHAKTGLPVEAINISASEPIGSASVDQLSNNSCNGVANQESFASTSKPALQHEDAVNAFGNQAKTINQTENKSLSDPAKKLIEHFKNLPPQNPLTAKEVACLPKLLETAESLLPVDFVKNGPPLIYNYEDPVELILQGYYADDDSFLRRKRVDGDDSEPNKRKRLPDTERAAREFKRLEEKKERDLQKQINAKTKEELRLRAMHEREARRMQSQLDKDLKAQRRKELMTEKKKEKELLKALQAQERIAMRLRHRECQSGPRDDLDLEIEDLIAQAQKDEGCSNDPEKMQSIANNIVRPEFPPSNIVIKELFPSSLDVSERDQLLYIWNFINNFGYIIGVSSVSIYKLLCEIVLGDESIYLAELHMSMLRTAQADMEEAHATGAMQSASCINYLDKALVNFAAILEESWGWGFDVDAWRAHVNALTWPEILRQLLIAWGFGPKQPKVKKTYRNQIGTEGEDVVLDESGKLTLKLPPRLGNGTVKAAAWQVLAEAGAGGLTISDIACRIQKRGLRDLRTSRTPEASVAGALSRDAVFVRVAPATYALQSAVLYQSKLSLLIPIKDDTPGESVGTVGDSANVNKSSDPDLADNTLHDALTLDEDDVDISEDDDEYSREADDIGEPWVQSLLEKDYHDISFRERLAILTALVHLTLDGPTLRHTLESRHEEAMKIRKQLWEEAKLEKKKRLEEAALKCSKAEEGEPIKAVAAAEIKEGPITNSVKENSDVSVVKAEKVKLEEEEKNNIVQKEIERAEILRKAEEVNSIRNEPLGLDRRHNRYWYFMDTAKSDTNMFSFNGRLIIESHEDGQLRFMDSDGLQSLLSVLDRRGLREGMLYHALQRVKDPINQAMPVASIEMPENIKNNKGVLKSLHNWISNVPLTAYNVLMKRGIGNEKILLKYDDASNSLFKIDFDVDKHDVLHLKLARCKRDMLCVQQALSKDAFTPEFNELNWIKGLQDADTALALRASLQALESSIKEVYISKKFVKIPWLVRGAWLPTGKFANPFAHQEKFADTSHDSLPAMSASTGFHLEWLPATIASVCLRLYVLDAALVYENCSQPIRETMMLYRYTHRPAALTKIGNGKEHLDKIEIPFILPGQPIGLGGRLILNLVPALPAGMISTVRKTFALNWDTIRGEVNDLSGFGVPSYPDIPPLLLDKKQRHARSTKSKGKSGKNNKSKSKSALRSRLDRFSEEEDEAERHAMSAFSDGDSEDDTAYGRQQIGVYDDLSDE